MKSATKLAACAIGFAALAAGPALAKGVTIGMQLEPPALDPTAGAAAAIDSIGYSNIFEGLVKFAEDGSIVPGLAESWEISEDGLTYTFKLRQGVKFHDGTDFDAEDVKFSLDRIGAADSQNAQKALYAAITETKVVDPHTVELTLSQPTGGLLFNLAWGDAVMVAPESAAENATNPVGTGPFKFADWVKGDHVDVERNPDYWGEAPKVDGATFKFIADPNAAFAAVMAGDIDAYPVFPAPEILDQFKNDPRFVVVTGSTEGETILSTNNKSGPLADVKVRAAIAHAIDRQAIIDGAMYGYGAPIGTHFAPHHPAYVDLTLQSDYDPEESKKLLAEAGYADGMTLRLKLPPPSYARRGGEIIASQLRAVGIETEITNLEWATWLDEVYKNKDYDLSIVSHVEPMDIGIYARKDYYFNYDNPAFDEAFAMLQKTTGEAERFALMGDLQRIIADDYVNGYLFQLAQTSVINARLKGFWKNSPTPATDLSGVYWE